MFIWALLIFSSALAVAAELELERNFRRPPDPTRPWVYWFWLNGNITSNGITADLEAMQRVGIGGALIMEVDQGAPAGPVDFMGPTWRDLFRHVHTETNRLGLEINLNNDAGWEGSGGANKCQTSVSPHYLHNGNPKLPAILDCATGPTSTLRKCQ